MVRQLSFRREEDPATGKMLDSVVVDTTDENADPRVYFRVSSATMARFADLTHDYPSCSFIFPDYIEIEVWDDDK